MIIKWGDQTLDIPGDRPIEILLNVYDNMEFVRQGGDTIIIRITKGKKETNYKAKTQDGNIRYPWSFLPIGFNPKE